MKLQQLTEARYYQDPTRISVKRLTDMLLANGYADNDINSIAKVERMTSVSNAYMVTFLYGEEDDKGVVYLTKEGDTWVADF